MRPSVYGATLVPKGLKGFLLALHADREPSRENAFEQQATCQQIRIELGTCGRRTAGEAELRRKAEDRTCRGEGSARFDGERGSACIPARERDASSHRNEHGHEHDEERTASRPPEGVLQLPETDSFV